MNSDLQRVHERLDALNVVFVSLNRSTAKFGPQPQRTLAVDCLEKDLLEDLIGLHHVELATLETSDGSAWKLLLEAIRGRGDAEQQHEGYTI